MVERALYSVGLILRLDVEKYGLLLNYIYGELEETPIVIKKSLAKLKIVEE